MQVRSRSFRAVKRPQRRLWYWVIVGTDADCENCGKKTTISACVDPLWLLKYTYVITVLVCHAHSSSLTVSRAAPDGPVEAATVPSARERRGMYRRNVVAIEDEQLDLTWQGRANCVGVDPDIFFPERGASTKDAKSICRACVVCEDCLEYALVNGEKFGIWGGTSERERRRLRRARAAQRRARETPVADPVAV